MQERYIQDYPRIMTVGTLGEVRGFSPPVNCWHLRRPLMPEFTHVAEFFRAEAGKKPGRPLDMRLEDFARAAERMPRHTRGLAGIILHDGQKLRHRFKGNNTQVRIVGNYIGLDGKKTDTHSFHGDPVEAVFQIDYSEVRVQGLRNDHVASVQHKTIIIYGEEVVQNTVTALPTAAPHDFGRGDISCWAGTLNTKGVPPYWHRAQEVGGDTLRVRLTHVVPKWA